MTVGPFELENLKGPSSDGHKFVRQAVEELAQRLQLAARRDSLFSYSTRPAGNFAQKPDALRAGDLGGRHVTFGYGESSRLRSGRTDQEPSSFEQEPETAMWTWIRN